MQQFPIDDDLVGFVWRFSNPQPFEQLTFSAALRRVLVGPRIPKTERDLLLSEGLLAELDEPAAVKPLTAAEAEQALAEELLAELDALPNVFHKIRKRERKPSPKAKEWAADVPELAGVAGRANWRSLCAHLKVAVGTDSARRRLRAWVAANRPGWPEVPDV
jgi:hypothetical protein